MKIQEIQNFVKSRGYSKKEKIRMLSELWSHEFSIISEFAKTPELILYCFKNNINQHPICAHPDCEEKVFVTKSNTFSKCCCVKHSQEITFLEKYGVTNPMHSDTVKEKLKNTNMEKFGVDNYFKTKQMHELLKSNNPMHSMKSKEKLKRTCVERFGVDNPLKNQQIADKVSKTHKMKHVEYSQQVKKTNIEKYGVDNPLKHRDIHTKSVQSRRYNNYHNRIMHFPGIIPLFDFDQYVGVERYKWKCMQCGHEFSFVIEDGKVPVCRVCHPFEKNLFSKGEKEIGVWLKSLNLDVWENNRTVLKGKELDIFLPEKNVAIEFNGLYWHAESFGKDENYHLSKTMQCEEQGIHLIHVLDTTWIKNEKYIKSHILQVLELCEKINSVCCGVKEITQFEKSQFLTQNNFLGDDNSDYFLGLFTNDKLCICVTFTEHGDNDWEIKTCCVALNTIIENGLHKILDVFMAQHKPRRLVYSVDRNMITPMVTQCFKHFDKTNLPPKAKYFKSTNTLIESDKLEPEILHDYQNHGYERIWDCGNFVFEWKNENV